MSGCFFNCSDDVVVGMNSRIYRWSESSGNGMASLAHRTEKVTMHAVQQMNCGEREKSDKRLQGIDCVRGETWGQPSIV